MLTKNLVEIQKVRPMMMLRIRLYFITFIADILILSVSFRAAAEVWAREMVPEGTLALMQFMVPVFAAIAIYIRVYSMRGLKDFRHALSRLASALILSTLLFSALLFYIRPQFELVLSFFSLAILSAFCVMAAVRVALRFYTAKFLDNQVANVLVINDSGPEFYHPEAYRINVAPDMIKKAVNDPIRLDQLGRAMANMDMVIVSCLKSNRSSWVRILRASGVQGQILSETPSQLCVLGLVCEENLAALLVSTGPLGLRSRLIKRTIDLILAICATVMLTPVMLVVALLIKLEDGGPVLFIQPRIGQGNRIFRVLKFRSMNVEQSDIFGDRSSREDDERVTRIGKFIRATSIDELPQLLNVFASEMSLVGPRPHALASKVENKLFWDVDDEYWSRHALKPGMTGLAQIRGYRGATDTASQLHKRLQSDLEYIRDWSPWLDFRILVATVKMIRP